MVNEMNKRNDITRMTTDELSLLVMNTEDLYTLAEDTRGWTDENAIFILKDKIRNEYIYNIDQMVQLEYDIKERYEPVLDLEDFNDPLRGLAPHIDTPIPLGEDDVSLVEQIYGGTTDE
jgi:hypothetical protein